MQETPFKFLDAYNQDEGHLFFGRDLETEALYQMTFDTRMLLVYGGSGTGKSSLIQAGLANKFSPTRWKSIFIRRDHNLNEAVNETIHRELNQVSRKPVPADITPIDALKKLYQRTLKPLYLIFDQFEELFVLSQNPQEEADFFDFIEDLLEENIPCKVIFVMREEFLASLWSFERNIPELFNFRFRVEPMREQQIKEVIQKTLSWFANANVIALESNDAEGLSNLIFDKLKGKEDQASIELTYLQVYLDQLYQQAAKNANGGTPLFSANLINHQVGDIEDVIGDFLDRQIEALELSDNSITEGTPIRVLGELVTEDQTKKILDLEELKQQLPKLKIEKEELITTLQYFVDIRILKPFQQKEDQNTSIELSHDIIAKKVWERLPEVDKKLRQIRKSLEQRQKDFAEGNGSLLGPKELVAWQSTIKRLGEQVGPAIKTFIEDSIKKVDAEAAAEKERERQEIIGERAKRYNRILSVFLVFSVLVSIIAVYSGYRANRAQTLANMAKTEADSAKVQAEKALAQFKQAEKKVASLEQELKFLSESVIDTLVAMKIPYSAEGLSDVGGVMLRALKKVKEKYPEAEVPTMEEARSSRGIAKWYHDRGELQIIKDPLNAANKIRKGALMFYAKEGEISEELLTSDSLFMRGPGITHVGLVYDVIKDENGVVTNYKLFHATRPGKSANISNYHHRVSPSRRNLPPYGNWTQPWVAVAYVFGDIKVKE